MIIKGELVTARLQCFRYEKDEFGLNSSFDVCFSGGSVKDSMKSPAGIA